MSQKKHHVRQYRQRRKRKHVHCTGEGSEDASEPAYRSPQHYISQLPANVSDRKIALIEGWLS